MNGLLRFALFFCPSEFRAGYADEICEDFDASPISAALDVVAAGIRMHAEDLLRDLSFALRTLAKAPILVLVAVSAITIGVGANVAVGSLVENVLLRPLPYPAADRLVFVEQSSAGEINTHFSYADLADVSAQNRTLDAVSVEESTGATLTGAGKPVELSGWIVGGQYFRVLGVTPLRGRLLIPADAGRPNVVISAEMWRKRFNGDPAIVGRTVVLDDRAFAIVGVAPENLLNPTEDNLLRSVDYWIAVDPSGPGVFDRHDSSYFAIGRLKAGISLQQARNDLLRIASRLAAHYPATNRERKFLVETVADGLFGPMRPLMLLLYAGALIVLLVAAANVANLLLARAAFREHELVVRTALGATRKRLAMQLAVETALLVCCGCATGLLVGALCLKWLRRTVLQVIPPVYHTAIPGWDRLGIDTPTLAYVLVIAVVSTFAVGLWPALSVRTNIAALLNAGGRRADSLPANRFAKGLVVAEIVMAFALMATSGILIRSFQATQHLPLGYDDRNLYSVALPSLRPDRYSNDANTRALIETTLARLSSAPGIDGAADAAVATIGNRWGMPFFIPGRRTSELTYAAWNDVTPGFFLVMHVPLLRGRDFSPRDDQAAQAVAIVSATLANQEFGTLDVVGRQIHVGRPSSPVRRIIGVVGSVRHFLSDPPSEEVYVPFRQELLAGSLIVRTREPSVNVADEVARVIASVDPLLAPPQVSSFASLRTFQQTPDSFSALMFAALALASLALALSGVYGVVAYSVQRRAHDFGIRMALGAGKARVFRIVLGEVLAATAIAITIGLVLAALFTFGLSSYLVQTSPLDPLAFGLATLLITGCAIGAALIPAASAVRVDPAVALRTE